MQSQGGAASSNLIDTWQITFLGGQDLVLLIVFVLIAAALVIWTLRSLDPRYPRGKRLAIVGLRVAALFLAIGILTQPSIHMRTLEDVPSRFAVLVDVSRSMNRGGASSRLRRAKEMLRNGSRDMNKLKQAGDVQFYRFADDLSSLTKDNSKITPFKKPAVGTDIRNAVLQLLKTQGEIPISGITLVSDGADTEIKTTKNEGHELDWIQNVGIPINTVFVEKPASHKDMGISSAEVDSFAFSRSETPIVVTLKSESMRDGDVEVLLWEEGALVQRRECRVESGEGRLTFNVFPKRLGTHVYKITIAAPKGDEVKENNETYVSFDVIRDKFRVLHVAGGPSWDQRFLRETLASWPKVDLVSFYILRTAYQSKTLGSAGMTLIPFPTEDVFKTHLKEFDVVIFQNFEPRAVGVDAYLGQIARFVRKGGAFVLIGGSDGLKLGSLTSGGLEDILPVRMLTPDASAAELVDSVSFKPRLTESGVRHPITQITKTNLRGETRLNTLARLDGLNRVAKLAKGAYCLAEHPFLKADDGLSPVIAVKETDEGRALLIATDSLWRWRFTGPMKGSDANAYSEFWKQSILWLTRSPKLEGLRVKVSPSPKTEKEAMGIDIELLDDAYKPVPRGVIKGMIRWSAPNGAQRKEKFDAVLDDNGRYHFEWEPKRHGPHRIEVVASTEVTSTTQFLVNNQDREIQHFDSNPALLEAIAKASGGVFQKGELSPSLWQIGDAPSKRLLDQTDKSLWDHPLSILLLLLVLCGEWILRKRIGIS